jgi:hypothetical protein
MEHLFHPEDYLMLATALAQIPVFVLWMKTILKPRGRRNAKLVHEPAKGQRKD